MALPQPIPPEDFRSILESLQTGVYLVDRDRRIVLWNDGCERITGYRRHEVIGRPCAEDLLMHCDHRGQVLCGSDCPLVETMRDGHPRDARVFLRHRDGQRVPVQVRAVPLRDESGAVVGACESFDEYQSILPRPPADGSPHLELPLDDSTGLPASGGMLRYIEKELQHFRSSQIPFGVLCFAIDDPDGLRAADGAIGLHHVVYAAARTLSANAGAGNRAGHWIGERFLVVIHGCTRETLLESALFLQELAGLGAVPWWGGRLAVTLSVAATLARVEDTAPTLIARLEAALTHFGNEKNMAAVV